MKTTGIKDTNMRVIYNRFLPVGSYSAINLFGIVFARSDRGRMRPVDLNHEYIHTLQQRELLFVFFYLLYVMEWLFWLVRLRSPRRAYYSISFEREAYRHQDEADYRRHRSHYAWARPDKRLL